MITGKRITIKEFETLQEVITHAKMYNNLSERSPHDHIETTSIDERVALFTEGKLYTNDKVKYMLLDENKTFIGTIGFVRRSPWEVNIGYRLLEKKSRQKGYLSEALPLFIEHVFKNYPEVVRISLNTAYDNIGSQKVAERSGFIFEGILRKAYRYRGRIVDFMQYSIIRGEYEHSK